MGKIERDFKWTRKIRPFTVLGTIIILVSYTLLLVLNKLFELPFLDKIIADNGLITMTTLFVLLLINVLVNQELLKDILSRDKGNTTIKFFPRWNVNEFYQLLKQSKKSVLLITTWHASQSEWLDRLEEASNKTNKKVKFDIFLLDPEFEVTSFRYKEVLWEEELSKINHEELKEKARNKVNTLKREFRRVNSSKFKANNLEINAYTYRLIPKLWICVIDGSEYIFTWFPNQGRVQNNLTFHISKKKSGENEIKIIDSLESYIQGVKDSSTQIEYMNKIKTPQNNV